MRHNMFRSNFPLDMKNDMITIASNWKEK